MAPKRKLLDPKVRLVIDLIAAQCAEGARLSRHELEEYRYKLGLTRTEVRKARDRALKLGLLTEKKLPVQDRRGKRVHYLASTRKIPRAKTGIPIAPSGTAAANSGPVAPEAVSTELLTAALHLVRAHADQVHAIEVSEKAKAELEQARQGLPITGGSAPPPQPEAPRPTSPSLWATLGQSIEEFNRGKPEAEDFGARWAAQARKHPVWPGGSGSGGAGSQ
jgi:hypothetical protein